MVNDRSSVGIFGLGIVLLLLIGVLGWADYRYAVSYPTSINFLTQWNAFRLYARSGLSPYSAQTEQEAERLMYGHSAQGEEEKLIFTQPFYAGIFILPFAVIADYNLARTFWLLVMEILLVVIVLLSLRVTAFRPKSWVLASILIFSIFGFYSVHALETGSLVILATLWIVLAFLAMRSGRLEVAGLLFSLATIYPKSMLLLGVLLVVWSLSRRDWTLIFWYLIGILFLSLISFFVYQDWIIQYTRLVWQMRDFSTALTTGNVFSYWMPGIGRKLGYGLTIILGVVLLVEWLAARGKEFRWIFWTACLTITLSPWIGLPVELDELQLLLIPLFLILSVWDERLSSRSQWMISVILGLLLILFWGFGLRAITSSDPQKSLESLLFPFPLFILLGLYWVRWWAIRPVRTFIEDLRSSHAI